MEVVWNEGQHFGTVGEKLDRFSTFGVWRISRFWGGKADPNLSGCERHGGTFLGERSYTQLDILFQT